MKEKTVYVCEVCGKEFDTEEQCEYCENHHAVIANGFADTVVVSKMSGWKETTQLITNKKMKIPEEVRIGFAAPCGELMYAKYRLYDDRWV